MTNGACPRWDSFVMDVFVLDAWMRTLQFISARLISGNTDRDATERDELPRFIRNFILTAESAERNYRGLEFGDKPLYPPEAPRIPGFYGRSMTDWSSCILDFASNLTSRFHQAVKDLDAVDESELSNLEAVVRELDQTAAQWDDAWISLQREIRINSDRLTSKYRSVASAIEQNKSPPNGTHSADFSSVIWRGQTFYFTQPQAECVLLLWKEWENGGLALRQSTLIKAAGSVAHRLRDVFSKHPAWNTMITSPKAGMFRMESPFDE